MVKYSLLLIFPSAAGTHSLRGELLTFLKNVMLLLTKTLSGVVLSFHRITFLGLSRKKERSAVLNYGKNSPTRRFKRGKWQQQDNSNAASEKVLGVEPGFTADFISYSDAYVSRRLSAKYKRRRLNSKIVNAEPLYYLLFTVLLPSDKVSLVHKYLKDQPNLKCVHIFRS